MLTELSRARNIGDLGAKAVNLGAMKRLGWPVADGCVIPDRALQAHLRRAGVLGEVRRCREQLDGMTPEAAAAASRRIVGRITATPLRGSVSRELGRLFETRWRDCTVVVRSSAVGEDGFDSSFAGQLDSHLDIRSEEALATAVRRTWASFWSPHALMYARHAAVRPGHMGVVIQEQVRARFSGVLFTRDPTGRQPDALVLEYCAGLGDRLVGGAIDPARLVMSRDDLSIRLAQRPDDMPPLDTHDAVAIRRLAAMALDVERKLGAPQDIEWCIDEHHEPVLLQARPITRLAQWSNSNISENYPRPVSPFLFSIARPAYAAYFRSVGRALGVPDTAFDTRSRELANLVGLHGGRLYYNLTNIHAVQRLMPWSDRAIRYFDVFVGASSEQVPAVKRTFFRRALLQARVACLTAWRYLGIGWRIRRFERRVDRFAARTRPDGLPRKSTAALAVDLRGFLDIRLRRWSDAGLADNAAMMCYGLLKDRLASVISAVGETALQNGLLKGLPGLASTRPVLALWQLSRTIRADPALAALFAGSEADSIARALEQPAHRDFRAGLDRYLERWGFRFSEELMLTTPTPQEDPLPVLRLLKVYAAAVSQDPEAQIAAQARSRERLTDEISRTMVKSRWRDLPIVGRGSRFRLLLRATHAAIRYRERARMKQALLYTRLRHVALEIGARFLQSGLIERREDVFLLTTDEVLALLDGPGIPPDELRVRVESRRSEMERAEQLKPPDHLSLPSGASWEPGTDRGRAWNGNGRCLEGLGASSGLAKGEAAVILDVADAGRLRAGQVLVTRQSDPGWAGVFFLAGGLVVERGGMLSHGAIVAREYGIPAVVGVPDATEIIADGAIVEVDGSAGRVILRDG